MKLSDFDYNLPKELIAQKPISPRDHSRLLVLERKSGKINHRHFYDILDYLEKGDVLVLNNSKVFPARLIGKKKETGGKIEVFLHRNLEGNIWNCLLGGGGSKEGLEVEFGQKLKCKVMKNNHDGTWEVKFNLSYKQMMGVVEKIGKIPLPPYIKKKLTVQDKKNYQTVYANEKKIGSVAAPTAGFHFTPALLKKIKNKGVQVEYVTLHVGLGTFAPVKENDVRKHKMHAEWVEINKETIARLYKAKHEGRRIIAVGTTSTRSLEALVSKFSIFNFKFLNNSLISRLQFKKRFSDFKEEVDIFITPGYKFKIVDAMITNFHLPKSTLLMLVSAFACTEHSRSTCTACPEQNRGKRSRNTGRAKIKKAYVEAIKKKYRFFSYGDAMFIY